VIYGMQTLSIILVNVLLVIKTRLLDSMFVVLVIK